VCGVLWQAIHHVKHFLVREKKAERLHLILTQGRCNRHLAPSVSR
jgi:hypothetical protein